MKLVYKRSSSATALAEPEDSFGPELAPEPAPAPAGALHRVYPGRQAAAPEANEDVEPYIPQRGSYGLRLRGGMPRSLGGRILLGSGVVFTLATLALTAAGVRRFLLHDDRFLVAASSDIAVQGNEHLSRAEVVAVFGADLERNIFRVPLGERRADLERLPWVAHATVMRLLPNRIRVDLTERTPIAFVRQGTQIGLVDGDGVLLDMPPESAGDPHYSFPVLTGLAPNDTPEVRNARMEVYRRFMAELTGAGPKVTQSLSEVDVTNPEDVKALVAGNGSDILVHFGDENFLQRYRAFEQHLPEWHTQYPKLASADMRYERQVVLEMQPGTTVPLASEPSAPASAAGVTGALPAGKVPLAPVRRAVVGTPRRPPATRPSTANGRMFAALAAKHRAEQEKNKTGR